MRTRGALLFALALLGGACAESGVAAPGHGGGSAAADPASAMPANSMQIDAASPTAIPTMTPGGAGTASMPSGPPMGGGMAPVPSSSGNGTASGPLADSSTKPTNSTPADATPADATPADATPADATPSSTAPPTLPPQPSVDAGMDVDTEMDPDRGVDTPTTGVTGDSPSGEHPLLPLTRSPAFASIAPPLGEPLPEGAAGEWHEEVLPGTECRDGSPMKVFYRYSNDSSNYFVFLEGGGVCFDDFFCPLNPANVDQRVDGESILAAAVSNLGGAAPIPQAPNGEGIFKKDPKNPLADWNAVYVPYCSGDVYGGTRKDVTVPRWPASPPQQFMGFSNAQTVLARVVATFPDAEIGLLAGSSAGGVGSLMHGATFADLIVDHTETRAFVVSDSGPVFDDAYLEPCVQKEWRELWGLDDAFPKECSGCFNGDGGGIAKGVGEYLFSKYPGDQVMGGLISSQQDEIMQMFFSKGLDNCAGNILYPADRYRMGLEDFANNIADHDRFGTYFMAGGLHMHLTNPRYYENNGVQMSVAEWLGKILNNEAVHVAP